MMQDSRIAPDGLYTPTVAALQSAHRIGGNCGGDLWRLCGHQFGGRSATVSDPCLCRGCGESTSKRWASSSTVRWIAALHSATFALLRVRRAIDRVFNG